MINNEVLELAKYSLWLVLLLSSPPIVAASVVGLLVAFLQAATQLQEQTLTFAVKLVVIVVAIFVTASLIGGTLFNFANRIFTDLPSLVP
ncbi:MAG: type III secretion system export apparatus subunit SctS [Gammaproteobacteria bacterium]